MIKLICFVIVSFGVVATVSPKVGRAEGRSVSVQKVNPQSTIDDALKYNESSCAIIVQDGKMYKVCSYNVTPDVQSQISHAIQDLDASGPNQGIIDNGYDFLYTKGSEKQGFGLYTYVLLTPMSLEREKALLDAIITSTPRVTAFGNDIARINVIYIPSAATVASQATSSEVSANYNFDLARALIATICEMPAKEVVRICKSGLSSGPYLFSYASPLSKGMQIAPPVLLVDLSGIEEGAFTTFLEAYKEQIKSDDISDGQKINSLYIKVLNIIETAKVWTNPVEHAVGDIIHLVTSEGGKNGQAH
jgi:hypothetical protein